MLIAPETMGVLAGLAIGLEDAGAPFLGCSARVDRTDREQGPPGGLARGRGLPTPACRTIVPAAGLPPDARYPAVLKPIDGAGSVDTFRVAHAGDLPLTARAMPVALLQPFHAGIPMSASFLVDGGSGLAYRDRPAADRDPGRSVRVSRGPDSRAMRPGRIAGQTSRRVGGRPARVRRGRFLLGTRARCDHRAGDQPACHHLVRGTKPALACRPPGHGLAGGLRRSGIQVRPAGESCRQRRPATAGLLRRRRHDPAGRATRRCSHEQADRSGSLSDALAGP